MDVVDKIIELTELFDDNVVTTADKIDRPQQALDKEAFDDFNKRNPMAGGGMYGATRFWWWMRQGPIKQGKNFLLQGKFHLRLGSGKFIRTYIRH